MSSADQTFLRGIPVEAQPPPSSSIGIVHWVRSNLFSSPANTVLTLVALALVLWIVPPALRFFIFDAVWTGTGRDACLEEKVSHAVGACWPFITTRIGYFLYGQYPIDERWRVNLTWILEVIGIAWLLWPRIGRKAWGAAYFFVVFPLLGWWLLSGGWGLRPCRRAFGAASSSPS